MQALPILPALDDAGMASEMIVSPATAAPRDKP